MLRRARLLSIAASSTMLCCGANRVANNAGGESATGAGIRAPTKASKTPEETSAVEVDGRRVLISTPSDYEAKVAKRATFDVLYVLDAGHNLFTHITNSQRSCFADVHGQDGRQWYPEVIVVGVFGPPPADADSMIGYITRSVVPYVDKSYQTKPYAAGRAVVGFDDAALGGLAVRNLLLAPGEEDAERLKSFRFYLVGSAGEGGSSNTATKPLPDKLSVYLSVGSDEADGRQTAARELAASLSKRATMNAETTMFVNREGQQTYTQKEVAGRPPPIELEVNAAGGGDVAFAAAAASWLGRRLEAQKLESLGSLLPWHEFK